MRFCLPRHVFLRRQEAIFLTPAFLDEGNAKEKLIVLAHVSNFSEQMSQVASTAFGEAGSIIHHIQSQHPYMLRFCQSSRPGVRRVLRCERTMARERLLSPHGLTDKERLCFPGRFPESIDQLRTRSHFSDHDTPVCF